MRAWRTFRPCFGFPLRTSLCRFGIHAGQALRHYSHPSRNEFGNSRYSRNSSFLLTALGPKLNLRQSNSLKDSLVSPICNVEADMVLRRKLPWLWRYRATRTWQACTRAGGARASMARLPGAITWGTPTACLRASFACAKLLKEKSMRTTNQPGPTSPPSPSSTSPRCSCSAPASGGQRPVRNA